MDKIILIGGGGHCKSVIDVIEQEGRFQIAGIVDKPELLGSSVLGYSIIGNDSDLLFLAKKYKYAIVTTGQIKSSLLRIKLFNLAIESGFKLPNIISPFAYVSNHAKLGEGTIIMHGVVVNASVSIGKNCIINSKALIEHDSTIEDFCHIATNALINGGVIVRQGSFVGSGVITKQYIEIKKDSFIKAGSLVK
jgi:sugar O-acyltransferase (sialic acid O-acetyltransferase NeuD family)